MSKHVEHECRMGTEATEPVRGCTPRAEAENKRDGCATWVVKLEPAAPTSRHQPRTNHVKEQTRQREWGGEAVVKTYCTAAAAQILLKRLGRDLDAFLAVADHADLGQVMGHLHAASLVEADATSSARGGGKPVDEPPLPFVN